MNLIYYEIKASFKAMIIWTISLIGIFVLLMDGVYPVYSSAAEEVRSILANFPPEFIAAFGMDLEKLFSYGGFYNFSFGYLGLAGGIMASALAISIFAREKRSKCSDFLLTKPTKREGVFGKKLFSCFIIIVVTNVCYLLGAMLQYQASGQDKDSFFTFLLALLGMFFTQIVFLSIGILFATYSKKVRSIAGAATAFGFGAFILSAISNVFENQNLEFIAPLKYFEPNVIFEKGKYDTRFVCAAIVIVAVCIGASFVKYCKSDVPAA